MALGSAAILKVLKEHADGKFESRLDPKGLKGDDRELAIWLNDYAEKQRAADQVLQKAVNQAGARLLRVLIFLPPPSAPPLMQLRRTPSRERFRDWNALGKARAASRPRRYQGPPAAAAVHPRD